MKRDETEGCGGFKVIKWKTTLESPTTHEFFIKPHTPPKGQLTKSKPPGKTLLVINVPPYLSRGNLRHMFGAFGKITDVLLHQTPTASAPEPTEYYFPLEINLVRGYKVGYVVFQSPKSLQELVLLDTSQVGSLVMGRTRCGLRGWMEAHNSQITDPTTLEEKVNSFMREFDKEQVRRKEEEKLAGEEVDPEGWVTITKRGKRSSSGAPRTESTQEKLKAKKTRMEASVMNYTPLQIKETKARQLEELKKKFEEDKQKVALLKQQRKFKPF